MATQDSVLKFIGRIGDFAFYKDGDKYRMRRKGGVSRDRIKNDPAYQRTRENNSEFGKSSTAGKLLRTVFAEEIAYVNNRALSGRLTTRLRQIMETDKTTLRGERSFTNAMAMQLRGFEWNNDVNLGTSFAAQYSVSMDRSSGDMISTFTPFNPERVAKHAPGATHFQITAAVAEVDFETCTTRRSSAMSRYIPMNSNEPESLTLINNIAGSTKPLIVVLTIQYFDDVNGRYGALRNRRYNAGAIVAVDSGS